ncbi:FkbM family methyltransferase [Limibaculum sp. FT325]|uniref:FkbM family methyltransferase n=1 Tax=Thermohalobaculum sediminis TaxID=2939436 RepID=UPI0020BFAB54|nr:FkbM family methyltransferase [Limibaculum sediminis]MCL5777044.1 FkbM family methyltransferase [Limibaculum sediminis]
MIGGPFGFAEAQSAMRDCVECHGVAIPLDTPLARRVITPPILAAILSGRYEANEARFLGEIVEPGDRVLEIGAGIGVISTLLARRPEVAHIVAVEANPRLIPMIRAVHAQNGVEGVTLLNTILGRGAGSAPFYLRRDFWMSSLSPGPEPYDERIEVGMSDLGALLRRERISLVICDVEGAETGLFSGTDLAGVDRVYMELHDHLTGMSGIARVFGDMAAQGLAYDPRGSSGQVVLFRRLRADEVLRPYRG